MTPAINFAKRNEVTHKVHEYDHNPANEPYGLEAAEKMGVSEAKVFKTLVVSLDNKELAVGVIPVSAMLSMKCKAKAATAKKGAMKSKSYIERSTGYVLGGVSPLGQKKPLRTFIDSSALNHSTIFVSAGRRGLKIELSPDDLGKLINGGFVDLCQ